MKALHVNSLYPPHIGGGAEIFLAGLVQGFRRRGHDAAVLATHGGSGILREQIEGVPVYRMGHHNVYWPFPIREHSAAARTLWHALDSYNVPAGRQAGSLLDEIRPDLIVCHNLPGISVSIWAQAEKRSIPIVQVLHDYYSLCPKVTMFRDAHVCPSACRSCSVFRLPHRGASKAVGAVVGVSRAILDSHLLEGMFEGASIRTVVHNARSLPPQPARKSASGPLTFGFIGGLTAVKGVDLLAAAFAAVARGSARPVRLLIAGVGKDEETERLRKTYEDDEIVFVGHVNPLEFFPQLDVCVVPSLWNDPFPGVVYESLGLGVPVIGARRGGIPEVVRHEVNGLLFEPNEAGALERSLQRLIDDAALLQSMRRASRDSVAPLLEPERVLDEYEAIFRSLTGGG